MCVSFSITSRTFITPGCLSVLNLRAVFLASGKNDFCVLISNVKIEQAEPSSYKSQPSYCEFGSGMLLPTFLVALFNAHIES